MKKMFTFVLLNLMFFMAGCDFVAGQRQTFTTVQGKQISFFIPDGFSVIDHMNVNSLSIHDATKEHRLEVKIDNLGEKSFEEVKNEIFVNNRTRVGFKVETKPWHNAGYELNYFPRDRQMFPMGEIIPREFIYPLGEQYIDLTEMTYQENNFSVEIEKIAESLEVEQ